MAKNLTLRQEIKSVLYTSPDNTTSITSDINVLATWIQIVAIATTPNSGATLNVLYSPPMVDDYLQLKDENGINITIDLNSTGILKLTDIAVDSLRFVPITLTGTDFKVQQVVNTIPALYGDTNHLVNLKIEKLAGGGYFKSGVIQYVITFSLKNGAESNIVSFLQQQLHLFRILD